MYTESESNSLIKLEAIRYLQQQQLSKMDDMNKYLAKLVELMTPAPEEPTAIPIDESQGTCPDCGSGHVSLAEVDTAKVYRCLDCKFLWAN